MPPVLPLELIQWIVDLLLDEASPHSWRPDVSDCGRVCRAWAPYCQSVLYRRLGLSYPQSGDIYRDRRHLQAAPHLRGYVRQFKIAEAHGPNQFAFPLFLSVLAPSFPSLYDVWLVWGDLLPSHRFFRGPSFKAPNITILRITEIFLDEASQLYDILLMLPNIHTLTLEGIGWSRARPYTCAGSLVTPRKASLLPPLTRLSVASRTSVSFVETEVDGLV